MQVSYVMSQVSRDLLYFSFDIFPLKIIGRVTYMRQAFHRVPTAYSKMVVRYQMGYAMGWPRLVGPLKLQVSFAEYRLFHRALSQKGPVILRAYQSQPPHIKNETCIFDKSDLYTRSVETMGWLRLVGSLKLQVSFAKEPYKRDDILQKRPIILRGLLIVATPYHT